MSKNNIVVATQSLSELLASSLNWVSTSDNPEISENYLLAKKLRSGIYQVHRMGLSAAAKMCVGVYGPSQSGKSYLVSALARKKEEKLTAVIGDKNVDFIELINPEGGKESTGLVTRFTIDKIVTPKNFPIKVKLLTELDLIKLFVNSYANDVMQEEDEEFSWHQDQVQRLIDEADSLPKGYSPLTVEDVYELEDYCNSRFLLNYRIQALKKVNFWNRAAELLPQLADTGRLRFLQALWEELPSFSGMYSNLSAELNRIGYLNEVYCAPEALFGTNNDLWSRSQNSIINVSSLDMLGDPSCDQVEIYLSPSKTDTISISNLCALTSELIIQMRDKPHNLFDKIDLLDFPGARSRKAYPKKGAVLTQKSTQIDNFLRGKVSYLFDKYSADLELTSMVLCLAPSNQEVVGLDAIVEEWIIKTHGSTFEERERLKTSLFVVLSKFDQEFSEGAGKTLDGSRWSTRLHASIINPFSSLAHKTNWVNKWDLKGAFNNVFWLRNPNADQSGLIEYEGSPGSSKEIGFSAKKVDIIFALKSAFLSNQLVQKHFKNPLKSWDAGMSLNDGGATYLTTELDNACVFDLKESQLKERIHRLISDIQFSLSKYYVNSDFVKLQIEKDAFALKCINTFSNQLKHQRLGEFINFLFQSNINTVDTYKKVFLEYERIKHSKHNVENSVSSKQFQIDHNIACELGIDNNLSPLSVESDLGAQSFPKLFVMRFFEDWKSRCISLVSKSNLADYLIINREHAIQLINEFEIAAIRDGLMLSIEDYLEKSYQYKNSDVKNWIWRQTALVTSQFNDFISHGGLRRDPLQPLVVNMLNGKQREIFINKNDTTNDPELSEIQSNYSERYLYDWILGVQQSIRLNASFQSGIKSDIEKNNQLGKILDQLTNLIG